MRSVRLSTGHVLTLDGDLLGVLEALYREVTLKRRLQVSFEDMMQELRALVEQMTEDERKSYLVESLFLNSVTYENEMLDAYMRKLTAAPRGKGTRARPPRRPR
jgi:enamine deaminase RidA (YjgF/YER057c/UK114 family)